MSSPADRLSAALSGRYRIERELGAGGMATVYLAEDLKHDRKVAIKVLKPELAAVLGADRFVVEIKTTAALSHPHILPLFDSGTADGFLFYVMPYIEGETIRDRLNRESQFGVDDAVRIAREVADALDYAHRHGIIHRDIKPENILLHDGRAMVMDFGIALAVSAAAGGRMTETGLSLGTPHYMSPEQATAEKEITPKSDVYSLASVLYEMLAGQPPHVGGPAQQVIMRIITEPSRPVSEFRKNVPANVVAALAKGLEKLPADRFQSAKEFADALTNSAFRGAAGAEGSTAHVTSRSRLFAAAGWVVAGAMALAAGWQWRARRADVEPPSPVVQAIVKDDFRSDALGTVLAISNDGSMIVYRRVDFTTGPGLFLRTLATNAEQRIGDGAATAPIIAPDGGAVAYVGSGKLRIHPREGGDRDLLDAAILGTTGVWGPDGVLTVATQRALIRIPASGGRPDTLTVFDAGDRLVQPSLSPDGRTVFCARMSAGDVTTATLVAVSVDTRQVAPLGITGVRPVLVAGRTLTYGTTDGLLHAVSFDLRRLTPGSDNRVVAQGIGQNVNGMPLLAVAPKNGTVVYVTGPSGRERELVLLDRTGHGTPVVPETRAFRAPRFSPDGRRIAVGVMTQGFASGDIWIATIGTGDFLRTTFDTISFHPTWEPDGRHLLIMKRVSPRVALYRVPTDATDAATRLLARGNNIYEAIALPDGRGTVFREDAQSANRDIYLLPRDSGATPVPLAATGFDEKGIAVSPDSKWLAYSSNESGINEVYIRRIEPQSPRWPVSHGGGTEPRWAKNGELFFRRADSVFVTRVAGGAEPTVAPPTHLFTAQFDATGYEPLWDVSPDGSRFAVTRSKSGNEKSQLMVLVNALRGGNGR